MIRVAIIDDHMVVRAGLKYVLESDSEMSFAGEFGGYVGAVDFLDQVNPDVTLLDVRMPDGSGVDLLREAISVNQKARIVMLTTSDVEEDVYRSIELGAMGYVMKESPVETILAAIRSAAVGDVYMSDEVRRIYETRKGAKGLSPREAEVLGLVAKGLGNREIGDSLGISENSVKMHLKRVNFKLGASDRTEAVQLALQRGFLVRAQER